MAGYTGSLDKELFGSDEVQSTDKTLLNNDRQSEVTMVDITREQWFWDQAVMS